MSATQFQTLLNQASTAIAANDYATARQRIVQAMTIGMGLANTNQGSLSIRWNVRVSEAQTLLNNLNMLERRSNGDGRNMTIGISE